ncbi:MAG: CBS domain-containing protein [bacterium]|nr:CBS domain-containing protein [bacterium]
MLLYRLSEEFIISQSLLEQITRNDPSGTESILSKSIESLRLESVLSLAINFTLKEAQEIFASESLRYALVQDSPEIILGVLRADAVEEIFSKSSADAKFASIANAMDRDIMIEPHSATVGEILNRACVGKHHCCVVVDNSGNPIGIISVRDLLAQTIKAFRSSGIESRAFFEEA